MTNKKLGRYAKLKKKILKFKDGEISLCKNCYCMTKSILKGNILYCLKCEGLK